MVISTFEKGPQCKISVGMSFPVLSDIFDAFNLLFSDLRKKNPLWDRKSVDDHGSTTRVLFTEKNSDGEF